MGEISEKFKKQIRDDKLVTNEDLAQELGDVQWYIRASLYELKLNYKDLFEINNFNTIPLSQNTMAIGKNLSSLLEHMDYHRAVVTNYMIAWKLNNFYQGSSLRKDIILHLQEMLSTWCQMCWVININPDTVCQMNLDKLASRKERNVISGSGDNR